MMRSTHIPVLVLLIISLVSLGCQDGPVVPTDQAGQEIAGHSTDFYGPVHQCLGYYRLVFDTRSYTIEAIPIRAAGIHLNVVGILNSTMGVGVVGVPAEHDPPTGLFVFDITLTHPFATKKQLTGFDVKGILLTPGTMPVDTVTLAGAGETRLENADGYTRWWNPTEFTAPGIFGYTSGILANADAWELTATVNPYKYFADCLSTNASMQEVYFAEMDADTGRGVFAAGENNTRRYRIRFPMAPGPQITYGYAVDASWAIPSPNPPSEIPDDFPIEANQPEPYYVLAQPTANTLYYDTETGNGGGVLKLQINIHDWQGQAAGDINSEIGAVRIYAPDLMTDAVDAALLNETEVKVRYTANLFGEAVPTSPGTGLVVIQSECIWPHTYNQGSAPAPEDLISAWNVLQVDIVDPMCEEDSDNTFANATEMEFNSNASGTVCPSTDESDYYYFSVPIGNGVAGDVRLYSDAGPTTLGLMDESHDILAEETTSDMCSISMDGLEIMPGDFYISVSSEPSGDVRPYLLELDGELIDVSPCGAVDITPADLFVEAEFIFMEGDYAFLIGDQYIWIYDVADPDNPVFINRFEHDYSFKYSDFHYPYCYGLKNYDISSENQIDMIDFTDPVNPVIHEDLVHFTGDTGPAFCMDEEYIYVEHGDTAPYEIRIYDWVTDPLSPALAQTIDSTLPPAVLDSTVIPTYGKYLLVGGYLEMWAYNIENLYSILEVPPYSFTASTQVTLIESNDEYVYVIHRTGTWDHYLYTLKFDDFGTTLIYYDDYHFAHAAYSMLLDEPYLYVGEGTTLSVFDLTIPGEPSFDNSTTLNDYGRHIAQSGNTLCVIPGGAGLEFFNVADPTAPVHFPHLPVCNAPEEIAASGDHLFVADSAKDDAKILTLDIIDPEYAVVAAEFTLPDHADCIDAYGDYVLAGYPPQNWALLDASNPYNLSTLHSTSLSDSVQLVKLTEDAMFVVTNFPQIRIYDYSVIPPTSLGNVNLIDTPLDIAVGHDHAYITTYSDIEIIDLTNLSAPVHGGTYTPSVEGEECRVVGDYLYITGDNTLEVADLADPSSPAHVTHFDVSGSYDIDEITVQGQYIYLTGYETPIYAVQRFPISSPSLECILYDNDDHACYDILCHDGYLYEMDDYLGVLIYDLSN